jgi:TolA-binding protein
MKLSEFKKLEESIKEQDFSKSFKNINKVMFFLSIFGHISSIFLAYFLLSKILSGAISDNPILVSISSIILLSGLELLKREIFDKFSLQQIKYKSVFKSDVLPLMIVSFIIVSISFYSSIKGAQEFSTKSKEIDTNVESSVKVYEDSLRLLEKNEVVTLKSKLESLEKKIDDKDQEQTELQNQTELNRQSKTRIKDLKNQIKDLNLEKTTLKAEIDTIQKRTERKIVGYKKQEESKGIEKKTENKDNSFFFVMISTLIELVILFGVYFNEYYKFRSYSDFKEKIEKDENYQKWYNYNQILNVIFNKDSKVNDKLPSMKTIQELCKVNGVVFLNKDLVSAFKMFTSLGVIRSAGNSKYIAKSKETAIDLLKNHFNIE